MKPYSDIKIIQLNTKYLKESSNLINSIFTDEDESAKKELKASISQKFFIQYTKKYDRHIRSLNYFVALNSKENVTGIIGLYSLHESYEDTLWLGWYCVDKKYRGQGIGALLLEYAIFIARNRGAKYLCLYTSSDKNEAKAQQIYEENGFYITKITNMDDYDIIYRKKEL